MDQKTIDLLYELGTRFAAYSNEKSGFLFDFMRESSYTKWRQRIVEASYDSTRKYGKPLITSDEFLRVLLNHVMPTSGGVGNYREIS